MPDSQTWLGLSLHLWGWLLLASVMIMVCVLVAVYIPEVPARRAQIILPAACVLVLAFFILLTRIHERHLLPVLPLLALTCAVWPRFWPLYIWLSAAYLLNLHFVNQQLFNMHEPILGKSEVPLVSALNLGALGGMIALLARTLAHTTRETRWGDSG